MLGTILLILLVIFLIGGFSGRFYPDGPVPYGYGYGNGGIIGLILVIILVVWLVHGGRI